VAVYGRIDTIDSPDDENWVARNMYRSEINTLKKCVKLVINTTSKPLTHVLGTRCTGLYITVTF